MRGAAGNPGSAVPEEHRSGAGPAFQTNDEPLPSASARWPLRSYLELGVLRSAVPCARLHARQVVWEWRLDGLAEAVELVVSELVTNGLRAAVGMTGSHYRGRWVPGVPPVRLWLCSDKQSVLVQVWDGNDRRPERKQPDPEAVGGRGLLLVEALSAEWGVCSLQQSSGKVIWALVGEQ